jgi:hypothetical protein
MATRHFDNANLTQTSNRLLFSAKLRNGYSTPLRLVRAYDESQARLGANWNQEAVADLQALGRGVRWAFAIEGGTALLIYAVWYLWHLWL